MIFLKCFKISYHKMKNIEIITKYTKALTYYSKFYNSAKQKDKFQYLYPLRFVGLKLLDAKKLGYEATEYMWASCLNKNKRNVGKEK